MPPSGLNCHWTDGVGAPLAAAMKLTIWPFATILLDGFTVIAGAVFTVSVAAALASGVPPLKPSPGIGNHSAKPERGS